MTLDEAIEKSEKVAKQNYELYDQIKDEDCYNCAESYKQFSEWFKELKELRELKESLDNETAVVYVLTILPRKADPIITVFSNRKAARDCYDYYSKLGLNCFLDKTVIYNSFTISTERSGKE